MKTWQKWSLVGASIATLAFVYIGQVDADVPIKTVRYTTQSGDSIWAMAERYDPHADTMEVVMQIEQMNGLSDNDYLQPGDTLTIPVSN